LENVVGVAMLVCLLRLGMIEHPLIVNYKLYGKRKRISFGLVVYETWPERRGEQVPDPWWDLAEGGSKLA
jgi:hypothetical protein